MKEKIENGPKKVRTFMVYLNVESVSSFQPIICV